jgi:hypothetical protein
LRKLAAAWIIGCVEDDDFGWLNIERLRRDGVDTSAIALLADAVTGSAFVTYTERDERHFIFNIATHLIFVCVIFIFLGGPQAHDSSGLQGSVGLDFVKFDKIRSFLIFWWHWQGVRFL